MPEYNEQATSISLFCVYTYLYIYIHIDAFALHAIAKADVLPYGEPNIDYTITIEQV